VSANQKKFGPVKLAEGINPAHAGSFLFAAFLGICLTTFISTFQPYLLTVNLGLPEDQQGQVSGMALFAGECVLLVSSSLIGAWSDRIGRRGMFAGGMVILGMGWILLGYVDSVTTLVATRMFMSVGIAIVNVMISALMADYPAEESRGKLVAFAGIAIGLGNIVIGVVFMTLPEKFSSFGVTELTAGRYTVFTMAALSLFLMIAVSFGLKGGRPDKSSGTESLRERLLVGVQAGRENPRIMLAYCSAFVARGDLVVVGTFFSLWLLQSGLKAGLEPVQAAQKAGMMFAMVMLCALLWAPVMGIINDRLDRVKAMALAMFLAACGYIGVAFVPDPLGVWMYAAGAILGVGQISVVTASQTLIGQEAPPAYRGSVVGMFSMFGAAGILFISSIGGWAFDAIDPVAPFVIIGLANTLLFVAAIRLGASDAGEALTNNTDR
jgi:MFS family permease